jgi:hypothetical protein
MTHGVAELASLVDQHPSDTRDPLSVAVASLVDPLHAALHVTAREYGSHSAERTALLHAAGDVSIALLAIDQAINGAVAALAAINHG